MNGKRCYHFILKNSFCIFPKSFSSHTLYLTLLVPARLEFGFCVVSSSIKLGISTVGADYKLGWSTIDAIFYQYLGSGHQSVLMFVGDLAQGRKLQAL